MVVIIVVFVVIVMGVCFPRLVEALL